MKYFVNKAVIMMVFLGIFTSSANAIYVHRYEQEKSQWCWAASAQMIGHTLGRTVSQRDIVDYTKGTVANIPADIWDASKAVDYATLRYSEVRGAPLTYTDAKSELDDGEPFYISIGWKNGSGHAVVVSGYNTNADTLAVVDPAHGCGLKSFSYDSMITECRFQSGVGTWRNTITV